MKISLFSHKGIQTGLLIALPAWVSSFLTYFLLRHFFPDVYTIIPATLAIMVMFIVIDTVITLLVNRQNRKDNENVRGNRRV